MFISFSSFIYITYIEKLQKFIIYNFYLLLAISFTCIFHQILKNTMDEVISDPLELKVCRVCFATSVKMFNLHEDLNQEFYDVTGLQLPADDGLSHHICYICCSLLKKATRFRNKCHSSHKILSKQELTQDFINRIYILQEKPFTKTNVVIVTFSSTDSGYSDKNHYSEIKEENNFDHDVDLDQYTADEININRCEENMTIDDYNHIDDTLDGNTKLNIMIDRLKKANKHKKDKYSDVTKIKDVDKEEMDSDDDFKPLSSYAIKNTNGSNLIVSKNCNKHKNIHKPNYKKDNSNTTVENDEAKVEKDNDSIKSKRTKKRKMEARVRENIDKFDKTYNCKIVALSIEEQIEAVKARAENKKYKYGKFKCDDCYIGFIVESKFISHRKTHDPAISGSIECEVCHLRFERQAQCNKHASRHKYKYICKECGAVSYSRTFAKKHYELHAGIKNKYECQYCKQVFSKYATRTNHVRNKHGSAQCGVCHELFGPGGLTTHRALAHKQTYKCSSCDRVFNDADALKRHMKSPNLDVCDPAMRPCTRCGECFGMEDVELFNKHIEEHREFSRKKRKEGKTYIIASNEDAVNRMNISVESEKDVSNEIGDKSKRKGGEKSKRKGGEKRKFMCEICASDNFKSITALRYHQRIHSGEKPHPCPSCPKTFRLVHTLQWHIRTHTGDRPYACAECAKAFKTNTALGRHKLVHTNERRHLCNLCGKAFQTSTNVKQHIRTVHMKIPMPPRVRNRKKRVEQTC